MMKKPTAPPKTSPSKLAIAVMTMPATPPKPAKPKAKPRR